MNNKIRMYQIGENEFPSVTTITGLINKPFLYAWYGKIGTSEASRILKESSEIGSEAHAWIENRMKTNIYEMPSDRIKNVIVNFEMFQDKYAPKLIKSECVVHSNKHGYAGTCDGIFEIKGAPVLLDWKTSSHLGDEYLLQVEAYYRAILEMGEDEFVKDIKKLWVVRLPKTGEINFKKDVIKVKPSISRYKAFLGLLKYFCWSQKGKK